MGHLVVIAGPRQDVARFSAVAQGVFCQSNCNKAVIKEAFEWNAWHPLPGVQLERLCEGLQTRSLEWFGHGCSGNRMLLEHELYCGLGMDALLTPHGAHKPPC